MAYPTVSAPYGLKPINSIDGKPYAGAFRQIPVAASLALLSSLEIRFKSTAPAI